MDALKLKRDADERARELAKEIHDRAIAAGCKCSFGQIVYGHAHTSGSGSLWNSRETGHIEIFFDAQRGGKLSRRRVNDCKKPIDVDKIVSLLVEAQAFRDRQAASWRAESAACKAFDAVATELKATAPEWLSILGSASGINIEARGLTAERARAIVAALKWVL
jgi:hypothetical protein